MELDQKYTDKALTDDEQLWVQVLVKNVYHLTEPTGHSGSVNIPKALEYLTGTGKTHSTWPNSKSSDGTVEYPIDQVYVEKYLQLENIDKDDKN